MSVLSNMTKHKHSALIDDIIPPKKTHFGWSGGCFGKQLQSCKIFTCRLYHCSCIAVT